jgi:hypothetical protein
MSDGTTGTPSNPPPLQGYVYNPAKGRYEPVSGGSTGGGSAPSGGGSTPSGGTSTPLPLPHANFSYTVYANGLVGFFSLSTGLISSYLWQFGDGYSARTPNAVHQYNGAGGPFSVTLRVSNTSGQSVKTIDIIVPAVPVPTTVDFTYLVGSLSAQYTDVSTKAGTRNWDFGDGQTSTEINPYHVYASNGVYVVTLTIGGVQKPYQVVIDRGVRLDWQDNSSDETGFKVERSPDGATGWTQIATTSAGVNTLLFTKNLHGIDPTAVNYFRVRATNAGGDSAYTNIVNQQCGA